MGFKRSEWNAIIQAVNDKITACASSIEPLTPVGANHRWSANDITAVRSTLQSLCDPGPTFTSLLDKWRQGTINELLDALTNCECHSTAVRVRIDLWATYTITQATGAKCWEVHILANGSSIKYASLYATRVSTATRIVTTAYFYADPGDVFEATYIIASPPPGSSISVWLSISPA